MKARPVAQWVLAGSAIFAMVALAPGAIIYHPVEGFPPLITSFNPEQRIDLDGDGLDDFSVLVVQLTTALSGFATTAVLGWEPPNPSDLGGYVIPLPFGDIIGPDLPSVYGSKAAFYTNAMRGNVPHPLASEVDIGGVRVRTGHFVLTRAYAGLQFKIGGQTHYAWADLENWALADVPIFQVHGWAYESEPNTPIAAGAVPEPSAVLLGLLGTGWLGGMRRVRARAPRKNSVVMRA
jgi:hypothetical protein